MKNKILASRKINPSIDNNYIEIVKMVYVFLVFLSVVNAWEW